MPRASTFLHYTTDWQVRIGVSGKNGKGCFQNTLSVLLYIPIERYETRRPASSGLRRIDNSAYRSRLRPNKPSQTSHSRQSREAATMPINKRSFIERRTGKDRRQTFSFRRFAFNRPDRRQSRDRRVNAERREDWVRISRWSSAPLKQLKIAKYLLRKISLTKNTPYR